MTPFSNDWNYKATILPIMLFVVVFLVWASQSEIDQSVKGEGRIVPSGQTKVIQHLEGGIIADILVKEGDKVKVGAPLFKLSQASFQADKNEKKIDLDALKAREIRLHALIENKKALIFSKVLYKNRPHIVQNEKNTFTSERREFAKDVAGFENVINQKRLALTKTTQRIKNLEIEAKIAAERLTIAGDLVRKGASSRNEYLKELAQKQSLDTQLQTLKDSVPVLEQEQAEAKNKQDAYISKYKADKLQELNDVRIAMNKLLEKDKANLDREVRTMIVSPVNGTVNKLYFYTVGGIIKPGDKVAEITPSGDALMVEGKIKTNDRALIWVGQKVSVDVTAFNYSRYGVILGKLVSISPDSFEDKQGGSYYEIKIVTEKSSFSSKDKLRPGMVANVHIITGKKSILSYLIKPLKDISRRALKEY